MNKLASFLVILKDAAISIGSWIASHSDLISAAAAAFIALFTLTLYLATRKLWKASIIQSTHMEKSLIINQRAWVGIGKVSTKLETGRPISISIEIVNIGKTPALNVAVFHMYEIISVDNSPNFDKEQDKIAITEGLIIPQKPMVSEIISESGALGGDMYRDIISNRKRLYAHGLINYDDIFGNHHWVTYCFCLTSDLRLFYVYKEHNDTGDY